METNAPRSITEPLISQKTCNRIGCVQHDCDECAGREQDKIDAARYRWLRDTAVRFAPANERDEMVWCVIGKNAVMCSPCEGDELDAEIDKAMKTPNV